MIARALVVLCLAALVLPVHAQTSPPPGVLHMPTKAETAPAPPSKPPAPAPRVAVQQVAPLSTPESKPAHPAPAKKPAPVVTPAHSSHAQKPPAAKAATAKPVAPAKAAAPPPPVATPAPPAEKPAEPAKGSMTGLPLPRFASLRSDEVNMRTGPGTRYPVDWVYRRRGLPVEIEREFEVWRLVRDEDGVRGWVHQATLVGRRDFVVTGSEHALRSSAADTAAAVAMLKPGVIGRIRDCPAGQTWCEVQVGDYRGWLKRADLWGAYPDEAVN
jgi:SH3-like domain-containing protein